MLDGLFVPSEADVIRNIPLARVVSKDTLYWPLTHDGCYTCKSGYRFLKEESEPANRSGFLTLETQLWNGLWSMKITNKVKNLVWRACRNSLPTKENLVRCTIITSSTCDRCFEASESPLLAIGCAPNWMLSGQTLDLWGFWQHHQFFDFKELLSCIIQQQSSPALFSMMAWSVWMQRNQVRLNQPSSMLSDIAKLSTIRYNEYRAAQPSAQTHHNSTLNSYILVLHDSLLLICIKSTMMVPLLIQRICQALVWSSEIHKDQPLQHSLISFHVDAMQQKLKLWQQQGHLNLLSRLG